MSELYTIEASFSYTITDEESITGFLDAVAEHLHVLGAEDTFIVADEAGKTFTVSLLVSGGGNGYDAINTGISSMRSAFHHCNGQTANWPSAQEAPLAVSVTAAEIRTLVPA